MDNDFQKRKPGGRFEVSTTLDEVFAVFEKVEGPIITSSDVAAVLDCSSKTGGENWTSWRTRDDQWTGNERPDIGKGTSDDE